MTFATNMQNVALRLLTQKGEQYAIQIVRVDEGTFVPSNGAVGEGSTVTFTGRGHPYPFQKSEIDGKTVLTTDIQLIIRTGQEIKVGDTVILRDVDYRAMNVESIDAEGQNIIYRVQLRA